MNIADLHRTIETTLASKRLGTPVFVRYLVHGRGSAAVVLARLTRIVMAVRDWLAQPLERVYALGSAKGPQVSLSLEFRGGATALVSHAAAPGPTRVTGQGITAVDVTLIGNHGVLYHDFGSANTWDPGESATEPAPDKDLQALIERALRSGQVETVKQ